MVAYRRRRRGWIKYAMLVLLILFVTFMFRTRPAPRPRPLTDRGTHVATDATNTADTKITEKPQQDTETKQKIQVQEQEEPTTGQKTTQEAKKDTESGTENTKTANTKTGTEAKQELNTADSHNTVAKTEPKAENPKADPNLAPSGEKFNAYVSIISNNKYVDGAMLLAWTLWKKSTLLQARKCKLVLLIPEGKLYPYNIKRLKASGWHEVMEVKDLSEYAPRSKFLDTFNKIYMFGLSRFHKVLYYDADVLPIYNPDPMFDTPLTNETWMGAIGSHGDKYFKTGNMVFLPSDREFGKMLATLKSGRYNTISGRDGELLRDFFNGNLVGTDPIYSQYRRPWQDLKGCVVFHYRGEFKPWYDERLVSQKGHFMDEKRPPDFGPAYRLWWEEYAHMHTALDLLGESLEEGESPKVEEPEWGGAHAGPGITKHTHYWLQRMTKSEYIIPIWSKDNAKKEGIEVLTDHTVEIEGEKHTCDTLCQVSHKKCTAKAKEEHNKDPDACNRACEVDMCHVHCSVGQNSNSTTCESLCKVGSKGNEKYIMCNDRLPLPEPKHKKHHGESFDEAVKKKEKENRDKAKKHHHHHKK
eukprot:TRINITY_DN47713_c0_g1_i1.p1 TRINITY_DN47713_c0_g1~~TRINITY_DN47713_c0_g1_i1.p1  ORF type:complete len:585 (+),score=69.80 TRINITY_DN47713_c0_g1_i1:28-1782(+)